MLRTLDVATSLAATLARFGSGIFAAPASIGRRPEQLLELYEFEACPYCRKVREALTWLDLEAHIFPCPKGGTRFRPEVERRGGKQQFPYLVDPNAGKALYESDEIIRYLYQEYGRSGPPIALAAGPLTDLTAMLASAWRPGFGARIQPSRAPGQSLELYSFESSPYCRIVREALSRLELPYRLYNVGKGSPSRAAFVKRSGRMQVPWLFDPNSQISLFESADIVAYLERTYAA